MLLVLFNQYKRPYQVIPLRARVDLRAMAMKGYSAFPKAPALLEPRHQTAEEQSMYSTTPAYWAIFLVFEGF